MDASILKNSASGRWGDIITTLAGISQDVFDGDHQPCPKCGGKDRFRAFGDFDHTGGCICNQCGRFADGISTIGWLTARNFQEVCELLSDHLGVDATKKSKKAKASPDENLVFEPWNDALAYLWCQTKEPITIEAVKALGGQLARYRKNYQVIAFPVYGEFLTEAPPVGRIIYSISGGTLPKYGKNKSVEWVKCKLTAGSSPGVLFNHHAISTRELWPHTSIKCEGPTDALAAITIAPTLPVWTNANGAGEIPKHWLVDLLEGKRVGIIHDADEPGQNGMKVWAANLVKCERIKLLSLPYQVEPNHGKDLRDWVREGHGLADFQGLFADSETISREQQVEIKQVPNEQPDDPDRLARLNLELYRKNTGGDLKFYRQQWFKWKRNRYQQIGNEELRAKVWTAIKNEFDRIYFEKKEEFSRKVTGQLVTNVIRAMESHCVLSSSIEWPCWVDGKTREKRNYISMANGILDLDKLIHMGDQVNSVEDVMIPHSPKWMSTFCLDYPFDPTATCPKFRDMILSNQEGDHERVNLLQEWAGYLISPRNDLQKFLALEGDGSNGKSAFLSVMQAILGRENCSYVMLENFAGRFDLSETLGKQANICADVGQIDSVAEGRLKAFTSADPMTFDRKNKSPVSCSPTAKLMLAWNNRPRINDSSSGTWRRMLLVPFKRQIKEDEVIAGMDKIEWWQASGELPGIFNWALIGLFRLNKNRKFTVPESVKQMIQDYKDSSNPILVFFEDNLTFEPGSETPTAVMYERYRDWCHKSGHKAFSLNNFSAELQKKFPKAEKSKNVYDSLSMSRARGFLNIRMK